MGGGERPEPWVGGYNELEVGHSVIRSTVKRIEQQKQFGRAQAMELEKMEWGSICCMKCM